MYGLTTQKWREVDKAKAAPLRRQQRKGGELLFFFPLSSASLVFPLSTKAGEKNKALKGGGRRRVKDEEVDFSLEMYSYVRTYYKYGQFHWSLEMWTHQTS